MMAKHDEVISNSLRECRLSLLPCLAICLLLGLLLLMHSPVFAASSDMSAEELNLRIQEIFKKGPYARERGAEAPVLKCATPIIRYALRHKELLWPENQFIRYRPTYGGAPELAYDIPEGHFRIHYTESGTHAVYGSDGNPDTIPAFITDLASYFEYSWSTEVDGMKYFRPRPDGSAGGDTDLYDVYVIDLGYYGYTSSDGYYPNTYTYIVVDNSFIGSGFSTLISQEGSMKVTAAHEFFHAIQYTYTEFQESNPWWEENTAVWMEDVIYDQVDDYLRYLPDRLDRLYLPLDNEDYMYGGVLWAQFLSESYGDDIIRHIFERFFIDASTAKTAIQYILTDRGSGWGEAMSQFSLKNLTLDYEEGVNYLLRHPTADYFPDVIPTRVSASDIQDGYSSGILTVSHLAAHYIMLEADDHEEELRIGLTPQGTTTPVTLFVADMNATGDVYADSNTLQVWPRIGFEHTLNGFGGLGAYQRAYLIVINPDPVSNTCSYILTADFTPPAITAPTIYSPSSGQVLVF
ncbi:MAG: MXAN_6640 family putative metalloprotease, partial [bacterium]